MTLIELMIGVMISSIILVSSASLLPKLEPVLQQFALGQRLENALFSPLQSVEKDLRRAGFGVNDEEPNKPFVKIEKSCVIVRYDENVDGVIKGFSKPKPESFAYRLLDQTIKYSRSTTDCLNGHWESLTDKREVVVTKFDVVQHGALFSIALEAHLVTNPTISRSFFHVVRYENNPK